MQGYEEQIRELEVRMKRVSGEKGQLLEELGKLQQEYKQKCGEVRKVGHKNN